MQACIDHSTFRNVSCAAVGSADPYSQTLTPQAVLVAWRGSQPRPMMLVLACCLAPRVITSPTWGGLAHLRSRSGQHTSTATPKMTRRESYHTLVGAKPNNSHRRPLQSGGVPSRMSRMITRYTTPNPKQKLRTASCRTYTSHVQRQWAGRQEAKRHQEAGTCPESRHV